MSTRNKTLTSTNLTTLFSLPVGKATRCCVQVKCVSGAPLTQFTVEQKVEDGADLQVIADHVAAGVNDFATRTVRIPVMYGPAAGPGALAVGQACDFVIENLGEAFLVFKAKSDTAGTVVSINLRLDTE